MISENSFVLSTLLQIMGSAFVCKKHKYVLDIYTWSNKAEKSTLTKFTH